MNGPSPARLAAAKVLERVEAEAAFAPITASAEFRTLGLTARDRSLATEIIYGVLRWRGRLDFYLARFSKRKLDSLSPWVKNAMRMAAYQTLFLDSVPKSAAVSESVELTKVKERYAAGFVNGVCRALLRGHTTVHFPDPERDLAHYLETWESHPRWLVDRWIAAWDGAGASALCAANNRPAEVTLRVNLTRASVQGMTKALTEAKIDHRPGLLSPIALRMRGAGSVAAVPGFQDGFVHIQDESSQLVGWAAAPDGQGRIADVCAGPGGKTTHLAELWLSRTGAARPDKPSDRPIDAFDLHEHRVKLIQESARRLGLDGSIQVHVADARSIDPEAYGTYSRVLVDAPCTGTGVLRRRPDLRWQKEPTDIPQLVTLQREILAQAARLVRPGGMLVYTTCSLEPEENIENARWFLDRFPEFRADSMRADFPEPARSRLGDSRFAPDGSFLQLAPHIDETDGMFIFRTVRRTVENKGEVGIAGN